MDDPNSLDLAKGIEDADSLNEQNISNPFDKHASWASIPSSVAESHKSVTQDTGLHLLSIDNGGVRGLSALIILEQLMDAVDPDAPPEPYEWFNMIGGTGTGGLIAIMLGRLKMSVPDCMKTYMTFFYLIFQKPRRRGLFKSPVQGRFDAKEVELAIKDVIKQQGLPEDAPLRDEHSTACKVFVCAASKDASGTICLPSYPMPRENDDLFKGVTIWEACLATLAVTASFDPVSVERFDEVFVDAPMSVNNPVQQVWEQAHLVWGSELPNSEYNRLVSIGTGVPSLGSFKDEDMRIGQMLARMAVETERIAELFRKEHRLRNSTVRYYRFNVPRGLEDVGLEETENIREVAAVTRQYIKSSKVEFEVRECMGSITNREAFSEYRTVFSLEGAPQGLHFVDRPAEMAQLESVFLPRSKHNQRQKIHILCGLGGIGKTQLAAEFARRHHHRFSSVFWLNAGNDYFLKDSIANCASQIPPGHIAEASRRYAADKSPDIDTVIKDVMTWLALPNNTAWLLIFDNIGPQLGSLQNGRPAYDIRRYLPDADHGSVLVTTQLAQLTQVGESQLLGRVSTEQGRDIFESWCQMKHGTAEIDHLLGKLDGLPLAIAQAGAYLQGTGIELTQYLELYEQQWSELMGRDPFIDMTPSLDYANRNLWRAWVASYHAICERNKNTANLLLLWSFLDNKDLWHGLFAEACAKSTVAANLLSGYIGYIARRGIDFSRAIQQLSNYSLVEEVPKTRSYAIHPVVHRWVYCALGGHLTDELKRLATIVVGCAVPDHSIGNPFALEQRLLPHAQICFRHVVESKAEWWLISPKDSPVSSDRGEEQEILAYAMNCIGRLFTDRGKWEEAEQMYRRALQVYEAVLGPSHTSTLQTVNNLGTLYLSLGQLDEAEQMLERALQGYEEALGPGYTSTLQTVNNLGSLYAGQSRPDMAEQMYKRALEGYEKTLGPQDMLTLQTINNLGLLYAGQSKPDMAKEMYERALQGCEEALGPKHLLTLRTVNNLGTLYQQGGMWGEAKRMLERALQGYEEAFGRDGVEQHLPALDTLQNLSHLYERQGKISEAQSMYSRALSGLSSVLGPSNKRYIELAALVDKLPSISGGGAEAEVLSTEGESSAAQQHERRKPTSLAIWKRFKDKLR
ncbi:uncharacterized protein SETTUDRAFT_146424 [Exserohilum turcica Et28A]|uniref:PNPLA domain-containing protein n=1 Tax=Exserohilum turcicum (strain 28A) TaxID=671987 RepID=R0KRT0_EXST2|nr:uncharacterized protein SETTUDRAFT_146424 [Exserohilum turcica Et28A]EOA90522.1 hypothetical protein SETTUDRAFT_146424 [Exserohilum turcica Et28A]